MKIDELLYHLHHTESLPSINENELKQLLVKYPYLQSLRNSIDHPLASGNPATTETDLQNRFIRLAAQAYKQDVDGTVMPSPVFDIGLPIYLDDAPVAPSSIDVESSNIVLTTNGLEPVSRIVTEIPVPPETEDLPFRLYPYEPSDFVQYLLNLPACRVHHEEAPFGFKSSQSITDEFIAASTELHPQVGSESLANLWASQGKYADAIKMYEILGRENPEKSSTFAAKITKLKAEKSL